MAQAGLAGSSRFGTSAQVPLLAQQSWALTYIGDPRAGESAAGRALVISERAGEAAMAVWALTALMVAVGRQGRYDEALTHARRAAALARSSPGMGALPLQPKFFLGLALFDCDLVVEARLAYRQALADEFGAGWWLSDTLMADAEVSYILGDWDDAVPRLVTAGEAAQEKGNPLLVNQSLAYRAIIATAKGDYATASELTAQLDPALNGGQLSYNAGILASATAGLKAAHGDSNGAFDVLLRCWRFDVARECRFYYRCLAPHLVRLALSLGHREVAEEVTSAVAAAVALAPDVATVRSLALRCQGMVDGDTDLMLESVAQARGGPLLIEHARACEDAATLLAGSGRRPQAAPLLTEALGLYDQAGADAWSARVRAHLRALGVRTGPRGPRERASHGWESLTATERKVSLLVAEGLTNGAVARQLYMSPHTVNTHLRHVFAKLGIANRVALATVVHHSTK